MFSNILYLFCLTNFASFDSIVSIDIKTSSGLVRGTAIQVLNQTLNQFLGIPFAEPPIGRLRFAKPKAMERPIQDIIDATKTKNSCLQIIPEFLKSIGENLTLSEDCLVLNIWSPEVDNNSTQGLKPVMFWIYGGGLTTGSIFQLPGYNGSVLATHDVVFVSANYRVGRLGFLYGGEDSSPGNLGFYDQLLALKWVRENIHLFGGNRDMITIFGESAGSWSVSAHVLSPLSRGLFQRAILESGSVMQNKDRPVLTASEALIEGKEMAKHFNCSVDNNQWLDCLRGIDANLILDYPWITITPFLFGTEFLPLSAQLSFEELKYSKDIDIIAGVTRDEGSLLAKQAFPILRQNISEELFIEGVNNMNQLFHGFNVENVTNFYLENIDRKSSDELRNAFYGLFGDILITCPTFQFAKQFSKHSPKNNLFFYEITYQVTEAGIGTLNCDEATMGICHGADIQFVFGIPVMIGNSSLKKDIDFSNYVMKMWTNFAKNGKPDEKWPQLIGNGNVINVKNLNPNNLNDIMNNPFKRSCDGFWNNYYELN